MNINGKWYTEPQIEAYVTELENKVVELEAKHWNECGQIAHYSDELSKAKELLKAAVEDFETIESNLEYDEHCVIKTHSIRCDECPLSAATIYRCKWRYADEALALIGEDTNVPASADDTNVGHKSGGWISCKDKMPEDNTSVLFVYVSENGIKSVHYGYHQTVRGLGSSWGKISGGWRYCNDDVTHWQPLPEPPKDGDTNG